MKGRGGHLDPDPAAGQLLQDLRLLTGLDVDGCNGQELLDVALDLEQARSMLDAASLRCFEAINRRHLFAESPGYRNGKLFVAHKTRQSKFSIGGRFNRADVLLGTIPAVWEALAAGEIASCHAEAIAGLIINRGLEEAVVSDLERLLTWARTESWPIFVEMLARWAELSDPTDPQDLDDINFDQRGITWAQGLGGEVLVELRTTALHWDQVLEAAKVLVEAMFDEDWAAVKHAAAVAGVEPKMSDLARTDQQRFHDAVLHLIRAGAGQADPGASVEVGVVVDADTLEREVNRQAAAVAEGSTAKEEAAEETATGKRSAAEAAESYRCETRSGLSLTPSMALLAVVSGTIRRFVLHAENLDVEISKKARLFKGPHREALIIRDRHCVADGCPTRAHHCEADHITRHTDGGATVPNNGQMRCRPCHRHKTRLESLGLWPAQRPPDERIRSSSGGW